MLTSGDTPEDEGKAINLQRSLCKKSADIIAYAE